MPPHPTSHLHFHPRQQLIPSQQAQLEVAVRNIFAGHDVHVNTRRKTAVTNPSTGHPLELDIWVAAKDISFEFQDSYHYMTTWYSQVPLHSIQSRDYSKRRVVRDRGSTLAEVPCWWDGTKQSLHATIIFQRPDLTQPCISQRGAHERTSRGRKALPPSSPIPLNPPEGFLLSYGFVPDVGTLMLASFPPLSVQFGKIISRDNYWWMGEKYDGVLCCWNPHKCALYSRAGIELVIPMPLKVQLQSCEGPFLCSELWCGRGAFSATQQLVNADPQSFNWSSLRLLTFDDPSPGINFLRPFEERYTAILSAIDAAHPCVIVAARALCVTSQHLALTLCHILRDGGEGVVMRRPTSHYHHGRSEHLVKLKASRADREALVVAVDNDIDINSYCGHGAIELQLPTGLIFEVAVPAGAERVTPGDIVTVAYDHCDRRAVPIDARIEKIRRDLTWSQVLLSDALNPQLLNYSSQRIFGPTAKSEGFWKSGRGRDLRKFFERYAKDRDIDPLLPDSWYQISRSSFVQVKGAAAALGHFEGSLTKALATLFPEVKFEESKFSTVPRTFWKELRNRKEMFDLFAKENKFDPLIADNWYSIPYHSMAATKGICSILQHYYKNNVRKALLHLYPNIGLNQNKFYPKNNWTNIDNRRAFLMDFGKARGFDPSVIENWNHLSPSALKETVQLLQHYDGSLTSALLDLFQGMNGSLKASREQRERTHH